MDFKYINGRGQLGLKLGSDYLKLISAFTTGA